MITRTVGLASFALAVALVACSATIDGSPIDTGSKSGDSDGDDQGSNTAPNSGSSSTGNNTGTGTGNGNGTGTGKSDAGASDASTGDAGDAGDAATATLKAFGETCAADNECQSKACFKGGMQAYCSLLCTVATAATDCPVPPTAGMCNNQGYCRK
jgi:hypothetical protein